MAISHQHQKTPILTLKLSSTSFLNATVSDDNGSGHQLYAIKTTGTSTTIHRTAEGSVKPTKTTDIRWPKIVPSKGKRKVQSIGVLVQMKGGRWTTGENFLTPATILSAHKFHISGYSQVLKWKRVGRAYHCTTAAVKGPVAILETAIASHPARLVVYETMRDKYDPNPLSSFRAVSTILLDYLIATSVLLATDDQEWTQLPNASASPNLANVPEDVIPTLPPRKPSLAAQMRVATRIKRTSASMGTSATRQLRRIAFGEQLLSPRLRQQRWDEDGQSIPTDTSAEQIAKVVYGEPLFPKIRSPGLVSDSGTGSDDDDDDDEADDIHADAREMFQYLTSTSKPWVASPHLSPSAQSSIYPLPHQAGSAPSHTYLDPSFYNDPHNEDSEFRPPMPAYLGANLSRSTSTSDQSGQSILFDSSSPLSPRLRRLPPIPFTRSDSTCTSDRPQTAPQEASSCNSSNDHTDSQHPYCRSSEDVSGPSSSNSLTYALGMNLSYPNLPDPNHNTLTFVGTTSPASRNRRISYMSESTVGAFSGESERVLRALPAVPPVPPLPSSVNEFGVYNTQVGQQQQASSSAASRGTTRTLPVPPPQSPLSATFPNNRSNQPFVDAGSISSLPSSPHTDIHPHQPAQSHIHADIPALPKGQEASLEEKANWVSSMPGARDTIFDFPPPAYHSINFHMPSPVVQSSRLGHPLPLPTASLTATASAIGGATSRRPSVRVLPQPPVHQPSPLHQNSSFEYAS